MPASGPPRSAAARSARLAAVSARGRRLMPAAASWAAAAAESAANRVSAAARAAAGAEPPGLGPVGVQDQVAGQSRRRSSAAHWPVPGGGLPVVCGVQPKAQVVTGVAVADEPPPGQFVPPADKGGKVPGQDRGRIGRDRCRGGPTGRCLTRAGARGRGRLTAAAPSRARSFGGGAGRHGGRERDDDLVRPSAAPGVVLGGPGLGEDGRPVGCRPGERAVRARSIGSSRFSRSCRSPDPTDTQAGRRSLLPQPRQGRRPLVVAGLRAGQVRWPGCASGPGPG